MKFLARMFRREGTDKFVEADDDMTAPDVYVHEHVKAGLGVAFVEVFVLDTWVLWRVEVLAPGMYFTAKCSPQDADAEMLRRA